MERFGRFIPGMAEWWSGEKVESPSPGNNFSPRRRIRMQETHVEVIGGRRGHSSSVDAVPPRGRIIGPPRLPQELILQVIALAADDVAAHWHGRLKSMGLLSLAGTNKEAYNTVVVGKILPDLHLTGVRQVQTFANALRRDTLGICAHAKKVKRLTIKRGSSSKTDDIGLYRALEETKQFERTTLSPLRIILAHCSFLDHLSLDIPARVLDPRLGHTGQAGSWQAVTMHLKEFITPLSLYGGDLNERLWDTLGRESSPTLKCVARWANLTHLQLHGPRFRLTASTAIALSQLPALTHIALIMPWVVQSVNDSEIRGIEDPVEQVRRFDAAIDALGRRSVLQLLLDGLGSKLQALLLIAHNIDGYVGSVQKLGPWFRSLRGRCSLEEEYRLNTADTYHRERELAAIQARAPQLILVSAVASWLGENAAESPHPHCFSRWMLYRAERQRHWTFDEVEIDEFDRLQVKSSIESWKAPVQPRMFLDAQSEQAIDEDEEQLGSETTRRWVDLERANIATLNQRYTIDTIDDLD